MLPLWFEQEKTTLTISNASANISELLVLKKEKQHPCCMVAEIHSAWYRPWTIDHCWKKLTAKSDRVFSSHTLSFVLRHKLHITIETRPRFWGSSCFIRLNKVHQRILPGLTTKDTPGKKKKTMKHQANARNELIFMKPTLICFQGKTKLFTPKPNKHWGFSSVRLFKTHYK